VFDFEESYSTSNVQEKPDEARAMESIESKLA